MIQQPNDAFLLQFRIKIEKCLKVEMSIQKSRTNLNLVSYWLYRLVKSTEVQGKYFKSIYIISKEKHFRIEVIRKIQKNIIWIQVLTANKQPYMRHTVTLNVL